jgi:hypothetical protein
LLLISPGRNAETPHIATLLITPERRWYIHMHSNELRPLLEDV